MSQMLALMTEMAQSMGRLRTMLDNAQTDLSEMTRENRELRERIIKLEAAMFFEGKYGTKEHEAVLIRLKEGDGLFQDIRKKAETAVQDAQSAKTHIKAMEAEIQKIVKRPHKEEGATKWQERVLVKVAPHAITIIISAVIGLLNWIWAHMHIVAALAQAAEDAKTKGAHP